MLRVAAHLSKVAYRHASNPPGEGAGPRRSVTRRRRFAWDRHPPSALSSRTRREGFLDEPSWRLPDPEVQQQVRCRLRGNVTDIGDGRELWERAAERDPL